jgi:uncharacterized protein (DUF934 family)
MTLDFVSANATPWQTLAAPADAQADDLQPAPHAVLSLEQWQAVRERWPGGLPTALLLPNTVDVASLAADLPRLALLVLQFPKWTDGRAYSQARLLRGRLRYQGDVRATGDVLVDMAPLLQRTGFSSAQLRADQRVDSARRALRFFDGHYQGDLQQPQALFHRQAA